MSTTKEIPENCPDCGASIFSIDGNEWRCEDQRCCCWTNKKQIIHYNCPLCIYSTYNANEDYEGEALQDVKNHLRSWHKRDDLDGQIKEIKK